MKNMISRRNFLAAAGVVAAAGVLTACGGSSSTAASAAGSTAAAASGDTIKVGVMGPLSGNVSVYGQAVVNGATLYLKQVNANGGINIPVDPVTETDAARKHEVRVLNEISNGAARNYFNFSTPPFGKLLSPFSWLATYWPKPATENGWVDFNFRCAPFGQESDRGGSYYRCDRSFFYHDYRFGISAHVPGCRWRIVECHA